MGVAGDDQIDRMVELPGDVDDRAGYAGTLIVSAAGKATFVDQQHDSLHAPGLQLRHQRVDGLGLVAEFQTGRGGWRYDAGGALQCQPDEGDRNATEALDLIGWKHRLAGGLHNRRGGEIMKLGPGKRMRAAASLGRMTAAILHSQQLVLALVE